jgi:transposase
MSPEKHFYGVDVAKAELVIACKGQPGIHTVANDAAAIGAWLKTLPPGSLVAAESTGRYHRLLVELAAASGCVAYVLNAKDVSFYAKALGGRAKTDKVDAHVIARFIAEHHEELHAWKPAEPRAAEIWELLLRRAEVVKHRVSLRQTMRDAPTIAQAARRLDEEFDVVLDAMDKRITALQQQDAEMAAASARLQTIKGVGPQGGAMLAAVFSRIPFANADALVAYSGLDPRAQDSGQKKGRRRLSKRGPAPLRRQAYLMGQAAARSTLFKPMYQALRARGFASTQALVILARKLLRIAFAVWKSGKPFDGALIAPAQA